MSLNRNMIKVAMKWLAVVSIGIQTNSDYLTSSTNARHDIFKLSNASGSNKVDEVRRVKKIKEKRISHEIKLP